MRIFDSGMLGTPIHRIRCGSVFLPASVDRTLNWVVLVPASADETTITHVSRAAAAANHQRDGRAVVRPCGRMSL
jgi:hypothetical protein